MSTVTLKPHEFLFMLGQISKEDPSFNWEDRKFYIDQLLVMVLQDYLLYEMQALCAAGTPTWEQKSETLLAVARQKFAVKAIEAFLGKKIEDAIMAPK